MALRQTPPAALPAPLALSMSVSQPQQEPEREPWGDAVVGRDGLGVLRAALDVVRRAAPTAEQALALAASVEWVVALYDAAAAGDWPAVTASLLAALPPQARAAAASLDPSTYRLSAAADEEPPQSSLASFPRPPPGEVQADVAPHAAALLALAVSRLAYAGVAAALLRGAPLVRPPPL